LNWFDQFKKRTTQTKQFLHSITHYCGFQESLTLYNSNIYPLRYVRAEHNYKIYIHNRYFPWFCSILIISITLAGLKKKKNNFKVPCWLGLHKHVNRPVYYRPLVACLCYSSRFKDTPD